MSTVVRVFVVSDTAKLLVTCSQLHGARQNERKDDEPDPDLSVPPLWKETDDEPFDQCVGNVRGFEDDLSYTHFTDSFPQFSRFGFYTVPTTLWFSLPILLRRRCIVELYVSSHPFGIPVPAIRVQRQYPKKTAVHEPLEEAPMFNEVEDQD